MVTIGLIHNPQISIRLLFGLCFCLLLISCDPPIFQVDIDDSPKKTIGFEWGEMEMTCISLAGSFNITQVLHSFSPIAINPKSILIRNNGEIVKYEVYLNGHLVSDIQNIKNNDVVAIFFEKKNNKNNEVIINFDRYLIYDEQPIIMGDIILVISGFI